ncbi:hypothetical protein DICSQDRAFT_126526 [Dichomitus squalens LYAD-421 SS1]|uniref:F-box domain-containing protein n=2 Tax=Dichomitus squalens TaxID=114155 RepID=A0A4Q9MNQ9_9APHY|nr:uncharacterized protein DICSQDRAFT_126526 [Dichomitus squalens LYAD-421 SS1]EJF62240.1 hypothetical protein DICSQDRAFT_126526 [Dichomitus squalens LYAD-421 SS1]TBU28767.1 hypothetical protein BD311DRAFT_778107 [Dichomitus squalens]
MPILFAHCTAYPDGERGIPPEAIRPHVAHLTYFNYKPFPSIQLEKVATQISSDFSSTPEWGSPEMTSLDLLYCTPVLGDAFLGECPRQLPSAYSQRGLLSITPVQKYSFTGEKQCLDTPPRPGLELDYLPSLRSVSFRCTLKLVHLELMKKCLANPSVLSLTFTRSVRWAGLHPDPRVDSPYPPNVSVTHLTYAPSVWREAVTDTVERRSIATEIALESQCLALITLGISNTAEVLELPMESAPIARMSELLWPRLREISLIGRYHYRSQSTTLARLLSQMPRLHKLVLQAAQPYALKVGRGPILGRQSIDLPELRTLILAYPDPEDAIFSISATNITHLSLRDWPRYYYHEEMPYVLSHWTSPLLTASECLQILKRMSLDYLEKLELVYLADSADDALLRYVASSFPRLVHLELHRYRNGGQVNYKHITQVLTPLAHLRTLRLNLNFPDSTGPRSACLRGPGDGKRHMAWLAAARQRGLEIADMLEPHCPALESVALLSHDASGSYWWRFRTASWGGERVEHDRTDAEECVSMYRASGTRTQLQEDKFKISEGSLGITT